MRVLFVLDDGVDDRDQRVAARNWAHIFDALDRAGIRFGVIATRDGRYMLEAAGERALERHALNWSGPPSVLRGLRILRRVAVLGAYDVLHAHEIKPALASGVALVRRTGPPLVFHRHHGHARGAVALTGRLASALATATFVVSDAAAQHAVSQGVPRAELRIVYNGVPAPRAVDPTEVEAVRRELGLGEDELLVTWVGRLRNEKDLPLLIDSIRSTRSRGCRAHLAIVGTGPLAADLMLTYGSEEGVHLLGHRDDVAPWYEAADLVVATSRHDACPYMVIEAMSHGKVVVAPRRDGFVDLIEDARTGVLVAERTSEAFAHAIAATLGDEPARARLGAAARVRYQDFFSIDGSMQSLLRAYETVSNRTEVSHH